MNPNHLVIALCIAFALIVGLMLVIAWLLDRSARQREAIEAYLHVNDSLWSQLVAATARANGPPPVRPPAPPPEGRKL